MADANYTEPDNRDLDDGQIKEGQSLINPLPEDNDTPFSEPDDPVQDPQDKPDQQGELEPTHQATDNATDIDTQQLYDEGLAGAAEQSEPNAGNTVVGYDPERDERKQNQD